MLWRHNFPSFDRKKMWYDHLRCWHLHLATLILPIRTAVSEHQIFLPTLKSSLIKSIGSATLCRHYIQSKETSLKFRNWLLISRTINFLLMSLNGDFSKGEHNTEHQDMLLRREIKHLILTKLVRDTQESAPSEMCR